MDARQPTRWNPAPWFLTSPPQIPTGMISRARLLELLDAAMSEHPVALVAAPSGYGKTALLAEWARRHAARTAWLTLTRHNNGDEVLLLSGILSTLTRLARPAAGSLRQMPGADARTLIGRIAEITAASEVPLVVIVDDAHHAGSSIAADVVDILTELTAGRLRFVLGGAQELTSWHSRRIATREAAVISAVDLAFTIDEIVRDAHGTSSAVDEATATVLRETTGGWPIAVHLRRFAGDLGPPGTGTDALLTDYIAGNVLPRLGPGLADFVLATSVCTRLTPELAQSLSGVDDAESLLEACVGQGLFLHRFSDDSGARVYRWHDEFATHCCDILTRADPSRRRRLEGVAAAWLAPLFPAEAVTHAMRAGDPDLAVDIIRSSWIRTLVEDGARALNVQCLALPASVADHPEILLVRACCLDLLDDHVGASVLTSQAVAADVGEPSFRVTHAFAMLFLTGAQPALAAAVDRAREMLERGEVPTAVRAHCLFLLGWTELRLRRDPQGSIRLLGSALLEAEAAHRDVLARRASSNLLFALSYAGSFREARARIDDRTRRLDPSEDWHHYDGGIELFATGFTDYWQNRTEDAQSAFLALVEDGGHGASYTGLARVYLAFCAANDPRPTTLRKAHEVIAMVSRREQHGVPWPVYQAIATAVLHAADEDVDRALAVLEPVRTHPHIPVARVMAAEIMRRSGRPTDAGQMLAALTSSELSISYVASTAYVTVALVAQEQGDMARAHKLFEKALDAGAPEGVTQPFCAAGEGLHALLALHAATGTQHEEFVAARLAERDSLVARATDLGSVLSAREREIYAYLCTTMTATEIGAALFVSVNTIRTHQRAIYRKLGVASRREAIRLRL